MTPKIELHLHLEGGAPPSFIRGLAAEKSINIGQIFDENGDYSYRDFNDFLRVYEAACTVLQSPEDFYRLTRAVLEESAANGVIYTEAFISPDFCGGGDMAAWMEFAAAIEKAAEDAERDDGITMRGIITCIRHFGPDKAKSAARCAAESAGNFITGFGIGGAEDMGKARDFLWSFDCAREAGLRLTAHAGEWGDPMSVRETWKDLNVERLGHGVRASEDPRLVEELAEAGVVLEVCPGSNIALGIYPDIQRHPIERLRDAGVKVTVSTDDPPFFHTTMEREFDMLVEGLGWSDEELIAVNQTALDAAFCDAQTKERVQFLLESANG